VHQKSTEPAVAARPGAVPGMRASPLRLLATLLSVALALTLLFVIARELIAARVPEHRAALEELIREQTGLQIAFGRLALRWGWYGPEAVFHDVTLGEAGGATLLHAVQLSVGLDAWRSVRSGHPEPGRITLTGADIDLAGQGMPALAVGADGPRAGFLAGVPRLLSRWRGGRIDIEAASLRLPAPEAGPAATLSIAHADLRRLGSRWSAQAQLLLPEAPREQAVIGLEMSGDPAQPATLTGTLTVRGDRLNLARWRALGLLPQLQAYLPRAGYGSLEFIATVARGVPVRIAGDFALQNPEWQARTAAGAPLRLVALQANCQLTRREGGWRLAVGALRSGGDAGASALILAGAGRAHGTLRGLSLPLLQSLARWYLPQLPLAQVSLSGVAQSAQFDWDEARAPGLRLQAQADLSGLGLADPAGGVHLGGVAARVSLSETALAAQLDAPAATLVVTRARSLTLAGLRMRAHLSAGFDAGRWYLRSDDVAIGYAGARVGARLALAAGATGEAPQLAARVQIENADAPQLAGLLEPGLPASAAALAARLSGGRIESADVELAGPLTSPGSRGTLALGGVALAADTDWPPVQDLAARAVWRDGRVRASLSRARSGALELDSAQASWDVNGAQALRVRARARGNAREALAWLREHPGLTGAAPAAAGLDLDGELAAELDLVVPGTAAHQPAPRRHLSAVLQGVRLRALEGVPAIEALRGTLAFSAGRLQRSNLTGTWLGGPVSLALSERGAEGALLIAAHGQLAAGDVLRALGGDEPVPALTGVTEWNAQLTALARPASAQPRWRVRADASLAGVASTLPAPLAKAAGAALPLHLEAHGSLFAAQLQSSLGDRLRALVDLERDGERWRIARGALFLGTQSPVVPATPVLSVTGRIDHLDLPAYLALCRLAGRSPVLPPLEAHLNAAQLALGTRVFGEVDVSARAGARGGALQARGARFDADITWPVRPDQATAAQVHLPEYELHAPEDAAQALALPAALGGAVHLSVERLRLQGRSLGALAAELTAQGDALSASVRVGATAQEVLAAGSCSAGGACEARFSLDSRDFAATLLAFGLRPDLSARGAHLAGELHWSDAQGVPLGTLGGHLHMQLEGGATQAPAEAAAATPLALLLVPALARGLAAGSQAPSALQFSRLSADYEVEDGVASTANLHVDGDTEMLVRARIGLVSRDYEGEAFILSGEERLPAAVRRLGPTPKIAALWLSLRDWLSGTRAPGGRTVLRLRGAWNDPIVVAAE
jgi:uncharacterized protein YhdP